MEFKLDKTIEILERTPGVLNKMLSGLSKEWTSQNEGEKTWSVYDVVGHLIHGEKTDWIPRTQILLSNRKDKTFESFDRFAQFENSKGNTLSNLLQEFERLRSQNLNSLKSMDITDEDLYKTGIHPEFGAVTLRQLLATWVAHDLNHIAQISRVIAKQYKYEAGPWEQYLRILQL